MCNNDDKPGKQNPSILDALETYNSYSIESSLTSIDDEDVIVKIKEKYPEFVPSLPEKELRTMFIAIIEDRKFIVEQCKNFSITLQDIIKIVFRRYPLLFNSSVYVRKLQAAIKNARYRKKYKKAICEF